MVPASLIFDAIQAGGVLIALVVGVSQVRDIARNRSLASLRTMLDEWADVVEAQDIVLRSEPIASGDSLEQRCLALSKRLIDTHSGRDEGARSELADQLAAARTIVHQLNDIGAFVEHGAVRQQHFFSHFHVRIIELVHVVEPYVLLVSAARGSRWGLRLLPLRDAALRYHAAQPLQAGIELAIHGTVIAAAPPRRSPVRVWSWLAERRRYLESRVARADSDLALVSGVRSALQTTGDMELLSDLLQVYPRSKSDG